WKIARALEVTFSALLGPAADNVPVVLKGATGRLLTNAAGTFSSRALFPFGTRRRSEFYELRLKVGCAETARPHLPGTTENLGVASGTVEVGVDRTTYLLEAADAILFSADVPHPSRNISAEEAILYLVMTYPQELDEDAPAAPDL